MPKKLYFLTTEIVPFANVTSLAMFSTRVPLALQEKGHDIRTIIPKYGYVSERKYILREVIRLREIPFEFNGSNKVASAKSAFIPKTRVQVYFLDPKILNKFNYVAIIPLIKSLFYSFLQFMCHFGVFCKIRNTSG